MALNIANKYPYKREVEGEGNATTEAETDWHEVVTSPGMMAASSWKRQEPGSPVEHCPANTFISSQ